MIIDLLENKTAVEKADIKGVEIAKIKTVARKNVKYSRADYDIEITDMKPMEGGVEVFVRAWNPDGTQIGFGSDGTVDIERIRVFFTQGGVNDHLTHLVVPDPNGDIEVSFIDIKGELKTQKYREDPQEAILRDICHTISVKKEKFNADKIVPGKVGNTTSTFYPNAGTGSAPVDGFTRQAGVNETFTSIRDAAGNSSGVSTDGINCAALFASTTTDQYANMTRSGFGFATSSIPDTDSISSATLSLWGWSKDQNMGTPDMDIVSFTPDAETTIANADYEKSGWGTTAYASIGYNSYVGDDSAYNNFTLDATGIAYITKTGNTYFGARTSWDTDNSTTGLTWSSEGYMRMDTYTADHADVTKDPKLVVEHGVAASTFNPGLLLMRVG